MRYYTSVGEYTPHQMPQLMAHLTSCHETVAANPSGNFHCLLHASRRCCPVLGDACRGRSRQDINGGPPTVKRPDRALFHCHLALKDMEKLAKRMSQIDLSLSSNALLPCLAASLGCLSSGGGGEGALLFSLFPGHRFLTHTHVHTHTVTSPT